jgi:hypothetical protein
MKQGARDMSARISGALVVLVLVFGGVGAFAHASSSYATSAPAGSSSAGDSGGSSPNATPSPQAGAAVGDTIDLAGMDDGEKVAATVVRVVDPARPASDLDQPESGTRLVGVRLKLVNIGSTVYSDSPDNGSVLVDKAGQSFSADLSSISEGASFPGSVKMTPGSTRLGYVVFAVPNSSTVSSFQFTLDSGFADQTGEWSLAGAAAPQGAAPVDVVKSYVAAINNRDFRTAWDLGGKNFGQSYNDFVAGFVDTAHDTLTILSSSGNAVRVRLDAEQTDGSYRHFVGVYYVDSGEIVSASIRRV